MTRLPRTAVTADSAESRPATAARRRDHRALPATAGRRSALLPMLHLVQSEEGYVSPEGVALLRRGCSGLTKAEVGAVATFYTMYKRRPTGDYLVSVCTNTLCGVLGGQRDLRRARASTSASATTRPPPTARSPWSTPSAWPPATTRPVMTVNYEFFDQQSTPTARSSLVDAAAAAASGRCRPAARGCARFKEISPPAGRLRRRRRADGAAVDAPGRRADPRGQPAGRASAASRGAAMPRARAAASAAGRRGGRGRPASSPRSAAPRTGRAARWPTGATAPTRREAEPTPGTDRQPATGRPDRCLTPVLTKRWLSPRRLDARRPTSGSTATRAAQGAGRWHPDDLIPLVKDSGLRGRGGAGFPTGMKWGFIPQSDGKPHYLVVNADEGEPGTCKDLPLMMADPHSLIEGVIIASYAIRCQPRLHLRPRRGGARRPPAAARGRGGVRRRATSARTSSARASTWSWSCTAGAGAYICGEETALLDSLEGFRGQPRLRPPFPADARPLRPPDRGQQRRDDRQRAVHRAAAAPTGGRRWAPEKSPGPKIYSLSGRVVQPGPVRVPAWASRCAS